MQANVLLSRKGRSYSQGRARDADESEAIVRYRVGKGQRWTNRSVLAFAGDREPIAAILEAARNVATQAVDDGWMGPPFDPIRLAELLKIRVVPHGDVPDARTRVDSDGRFVIELNPLRPRVRQRFSIAHEISHTLFPDCAESIRNRIAHAEVSPDRWELEALCNIGAAELLMPLGSMPVDLKFGDIDQTLDLRKRYEVSVESIAIRTVQLANVPIAMFSASRIDSGRSEGRYKLDYAIESAQWTNGIEPGALLPKDSPVRLCTAIGYTQKGPAGFGGDDTYLECVGVGGYPGALFPRVVGYLYQPGTDFEVEHITNLIGNAVEPEIEGVRIVAFMTNDVTPNWGGGFARQVMARHGEVQVAFRQIVEEDRQALRLGAIHLIRADENLYYAPIVAQHGLGKSDEPRIRYAALEEAFRKLGVRAAELEATVHMPRLGLGLAGGNWNVIREMIQQYLAPSARVYVYELPQRLGKSA